MLPTTSRFESLAALPADDVVDQLPSVLVALARDPRLWETYIRPLLAQSDAAEAITTLPLVATPGGVSVQLFRWLPGAATQIHDHSSWGAVACVVGSLTEERFRRLDDGAQLNVAQLRKAWQRDWAPTDGVSTLLPYAAGIHRIINRRAEMAISLHCYGPPGDIDGRDYDPDRDYVCDRWHEPQEASLWLLQ